MVINEIPFHKMTWNFTNIGHRIAVNIKQNPYYIESCTMLRNGTCITIQTIYNNNLQSLNNSILITDSGITVKHMNKYQTSRPHILTYIDLD